MYQVILKIKRFDTTVLHFCIDCKKNVYSKKK